MGLFSSIKKFVKKIAHGVRDVFREVRKGFSKLMKNKMVRGLLLATAIFSMGAGLAALGAGGSWSQVAQAVISKAASVVTSPLRMIAGGVKSLGGMMGSETLTSFGQALTNGLSNFQAGADNLFSVVETGADLASLADTGQAAQAVVEAGTSSSAADIGGFTAPEGTGMGLVPTPGESPKLSLLSTAKTAETGLTDLAASTAEVAKVPPVKEGFFSRAMDFAKDPENALVTATGMNLAFKGISAGLAEEPDPSKQARREWQFRNQMAQENRPPRFQMGSSPGLGAENQKIRDRGDAAQLNIQTPRRRQRPMMSQAVGLGTAPTLYKPMFSGG